MQKVIDELTAAGLGVAVHENNSGSGKPNHLSVVGGKRRVEYWPSTGTAYADKTKDMPRVKLYSATTWRVIQLARTGK